jgi:glycosyltransferase A (GT-A) superfamily protein (DUF2064 family)
MDDRRLLFFVKNPGQEAVKTRLANAVGEEVAWGLYRNFILDMLSTMQRKSFPLAICFHPEDALADLKKILGENHGYEPQGGIIWATVYFLGLTSCPPNLLRIAANNLAA